MGFLTRRPFGPAPGRVSDGFFLAIIAPHDVIVVASSVKNLRVQNLCNRNAE